LDTVALLHDQLATTMLLFMAAVGIWGLSTFIRGGTLSGSVSGALAIGQVLVTIQILLGTIIYLGDRRAGNVVHYLYGITAILVLPFVWSYARSRHPRQALFFYSLVSLFIVGLTVRAMTTAS